MTLNGYRRLAQVIAEGTDSSTLSRELHRVPANERVDLCGYAWGLLDPAYDSEREAALWLHAWALEAERQEQRGGGAALDPLD